MSDVLPLAPILLQVGDWAELASLAGPVRRDVFVREQGIAEELEWDAMDAACVHCVAFAGDLPVGTGRLLPDAHIGRMAVLADFRHRRIGGMILDRLIDIGRARGDRCLRLNAQQYVTGFYRQRGFVEVGEPFMEAGIAHLAMRLDL